MEKGEKRKTLFFFSRALGRGRKFSFSIWFRLDSWHPKEQDPDLVGTPSVGVTLQVLKLLERFPWPLIPRQCAVLRDPQLLPTTAGSPAWQNTEIKSNFTFSCSSIPSFLQQLLFVFSHQFFLTLLPKSGDNWVHWLPKPPKYCCHFLVWTFSSDGLDQCCCFWAGEHKSSFDFGQIFPLSQQLNPPSENNISQPTIFYSQAIHPKKVLWICWRNKTEAKAERTLRKGDKEWLWEGFAAFFCLRPVGLGIRAVSINGFCSYLNALALLGRLISCKSCLLLSVLLCEGTNATIRPLRDFPKHSWWKVKQKNWDAALLNEESIKTPA